MNKLIALATLIFFSSCYTANRATKQVVKAQAIHPAVVQEACATFYPTLDSTHIIETVIAGDTIVFTDTLLQTHTDTLTNVHYRYVNKTKVVHDTLIRLKYQQVVNKAHEMHLEAMVSSSDKKIASMATTNRYLWIAVAVLSIYTLLRWILRMLTPIKLP